MSKSRKMTMEETLRKAIERSGESVSVVAKESGVAQPILYRFVHGDQGMTLRNAEKLVRYFGFELVSKR